MKRVAGSTGRGMLRWLCFFCAPLGLLGFGEKSLGQTATAYDLRNNIPGVKSPNLRITALESTTTSVDSNLAINFTGDGRPVNFLEIYFVGTNVSGQKNLWSPGAMDFKLTGRYDGTTTYLTSPLNPTAPGDWGQVFGTPMNAGWDMPIYTQDGWNVHRAEFFFPEMTTIPGQQYTVTWSGYGILSSSGYVYALFSDNSNGSFGASSDWYFNSPDVPKSLTTGGAPFPTAAARIGFMPPAFCPGDANGDRVVDFNDITTVLADWLSDYSPGTGEGDANGDGVVNFDDITEVLSRWLVPCP